MTFKIEIPLSRFPLQDLMDEISERNKNAKPMEKVTINKWLKSEVEYRAKKQVEHAS